MKKITSIFMIAVMVCSLSGCSQEKTDLQEKTNLQEKADQANQQEGSIMPVEETIPEEKEKASAGGEDNTKPQGETIQEEGKISDSERADQNKAYGEILWDVYYLGEIEGIEYTAPNREGNKNGDFAIYDIDGDGLEELLLSFDGGNMASMSEYIWGYENGKTHVELSEWPSMRYYNNGIIEVDWSHNQGLAGDFWPYSAYSYNSETDEYQRFASVDAWDKISTEVEVRADGEAFPSSIDADGDGIVYYVLPADWDGHYDMTPLDGKDYESWRNDYLDGAEEIKEEVIMFQPLSEENISKLGAPKPDIQFPEPQG
ncbi:MAG: hypothetical protein NC243_07515 [Lachnoclostridium sp.]|nr:hypothetical protein [Lachnoclostridium sp.]MCM1384381.1 hypothetical protein [Lachnoclostridium sp.]